MIGHRVRIIRDGAEPFEGTLLRSDTAGVIVHNIDGFRDDRLFIPYSRIIEIQDKGRVP